MITEQQVVALKASFAEQMVETEELISKLEAELADKKEYLMKLRGSIETLNIVRGVMDDVTPPIEEQPSPTQFIVEDDLADDFDPESEDGRFTVTPDGPQSLSEIMAAQGGQPVKKTRPENIKSKYVTQVKYEGGATGEVEINEPADVVYVDVPEGLYGVPTRVLDAQLARKWRAEGLTEEEIADKLPDVNDAQEVECR